MEDFFSWKVELTTPKIRKRKWMESKIMELVTLETLPRVIDECITSGLYAWDIETEGLNKNTYSTSLVEGRTQHAIVGHCLSPDGIRGYYIPLRHKRGVKHNLPLSVVNEQLKRLVDSPARAIFFNGFFDHTFLQFNGGEPLGTWDDADKWEDVFILAYLDNSKAESEKTSIGLKALSQRELGYRQIELKELYPEDYKGNLDFSELDPSWEPCIWYAASDAICTYETYFPLKERVLRPNGNKNRGQSIVYKIEKMCAPATRWMERVGCPIRQDIVADLIRTGQKEYFESLQEVYNFCREIVGRNIEPSWFGLFKQNLDTDNVEFNITEQINAARKMAERISYKDKSTIIKVIDGVGKEFPKTYDILSRPQLGPLFEEMGIPDLNRTEKSGQVQTTQAEIDRLNQKFGDKYPFLPKISRLGELQKALGTYLFSLYNDLGPDGRLHCKFKQLGTETGRFTTPRGRHEEGGTAYTLHGTPSNKDDKKPTCMTGIRGAFHAREGRCIVAIDYASVELRIVTNLSQEPLWLAEYFRCSTCSEEFPQDQTPPTICPKCGSDKVGDLHTLTATAFYSKEKMKTKQWSLLRQRAKAANFACIYGGGPSALRRATGCEEHEAAHQHRVFNETYVVLKDWWDRVISFAHKYEYVTSAFGRHYPLKEINLPLSPHQEPDYEKRRMNKKIVSAAKRNAVNAPVQMTSADFTKLAMGLVYLEIKRRDWWDKVNMFITIHDELVFEVAFEVLADFLDVIPNLMTRNKAVSGLGWKVPLVSDTEMGFDWTVPFNIIDWQNGLVREDGVVLDKKGRPTNKRWPMEFVRALAPRYGVQRIQETPEYVDVHMKEMTESAVRILANCMSENQSESGSKINIFNSKGEKIHESSYKVDSIGLLYDLKIAGIIDETKVSA